MQKLWQSVVYVEPMSTLDRNVLLLPGCMCQSHCGQRLVEGGGREGGEGGKGRREGGKKGGKKGGNEGGKEEEREKGREVRKK